MGAAVRQEGVVAVAAVGLGPVPVLVVLTGDLVIAGRLRQLAEENTLTIADPAEMELGANGHRRTEPAGTEPGNGGTQPVAAVIDLLRPDALERVRTWRARWPDALIAGHLGVPDRELWVSAQRPAATWSPTAARWCRGCGSGWPGPAASAPGTSRCSRRPTPPDASGSSSVLRTRRPASLLPRGRPVAGGGDRCPHAGSGLSGGTIEGTVLTCPRHGSRFDICTGERLRGPADTGIPVFPLVQEGGQVCLLIRE